ncbi:PREDICTED: protein split ends-like [Papilio polytes]|uniref:protein split ends-like n=1 Tax=Papilio polytes TaxID=76194 RepID=UPI000676AA8C|nr:PREDICTED: protein split ends-like [Papilio polytes]
MVRETRHLWVGNLPDNIREDRIREHFKRYGRVQNVKLLGRMENATAGANGTTISGFCATVAFMDIKSASKAHNAEHILDERTLTTEYYEPAAIPSAAGAPSAGSSPAGSGYSGSSSSVNSAPAPAAIARFHLSGEESAGNACAMAASAAAPATWRGTNDSASEFCRRGTTPTTYGRYQRHNAAASYATPPSNVERTTPHHRWYASGDRATSGGAAGVGGAVGGAGGGESTPSTPGGGTEGGRRRRRSGSGSSRSDTSSPEPSDTSRASTPAAPPPDRRLGPRRTPPNHLHEWASIANGRPLGICVRNLPTRSTDSSLKDGLYHEYKKHGKVVWVKVVGQNADRYAVVRFKKPSDVDKALEVSQDKLFFGCKISVAPHQDCDEDSESAKPYETDIDEYHPKATRTLFIGNLEKDVTQQQLRDKFKHYGRIIEIDIKKGSGGGAGYAFCQYQSISSVVEAIRAMDGEYVGGSRVKLGFGKPVATTCVWVDGLTEHTEKQVLSAVSRCGAATSVCVDRAAGAALVHFEQAAAAGAAVRELRRVAALASAAEPDHPRLAVDYASRECQEAFYEQLEKHGGSATMPGSERLTGDLSTRFLPSTRHDQLRYDGARTRTPSFSRATSRTPRYPTHEHYDPAEYAADRRYRVYEELGSSPQTDETPYEDRLQSVVVSPHRTHRHRRDSSPEDRKHSKERHRSVGGSSRRSRSGSRGGSAHGSRRRHRRRRDGSESRGSRAGTPLRDEPDAPPAEPRRPPRERPPLPMSLPLPKFAAQLLRAAPPAPRPPQASAPDSPPRPPSASSSSTGSAPHSPSLEERIRSLDEKYEKWSGSRALADAPDRARLRHRLLEVDINEVKPSEVVRSLLAKRSVFDEDSERLEGATRPPSPDGSPHGRPSPCPSRALRYPFPTHPSHPPPVPPVTSCGSTSCSVPLALSNNAPPSPLCPPPPECDIEPSDRPADPRLNRPERPFKLEKLGKFNESDYRADSRVRLRTPSVDKLQNELTEPKTSPGSDKDRVEPDKECKRETESRKRDLCLLGREQHSKPLTKDVFKDCFDKIDSVIQNRERLPNHDMDDGLKKIEDNYPSILSSIKTEKNTNHIELSSVNDSNTNCNHIESEGKQDNEDLLILDALSSKQNSEEDLFFKRGHHIKLETPKDNTTGKFDCENKLDNCSQLLNTFDKRNIVGKEPQLSNHLNVVNYVETNNKNDTHFEFKNNENNKEKSISNLFDCFSNQLLQKENEELAHSEPRLDVTSNTLDKKFVESKTVEDTIRSDHEKLKHCKERTEKDKHDLDKEKLRKSNKVEMHDKDKKIKEESSKHKTHSERLDKSKSEKDTPERYEKDSERTKHIDEKLRQENHKKDKADRDKKKEIIENEVGKSKREDKYKSERVKKDNLDNKRDHAKKEHDSKSSKSRDNSSRDLCRKDSTDSSTSRASHDSLKTKDLDNEIREESKTKAKICTDHAAKYNLEKDSMQKCNDSKIDSKQKVLKHDTKEDKLCLDGNFKNKIENISEHITKSKTDLSEKQRHYSLDSPVVDCKRKERLNSCSSLPPNIGNKRRLSSQDSLDCLEDIKKCKSDIKSLERRDSKDRGSERHKTTKFNKGHFAKLIESKTKDDKKNLVKPPDEGFVDIKDNEIKETSDKVKHFKKSPKPHDFDKSNDSSVIHSDALQNNFDFLATLELRSSEEDEKQKALRKEMKEKKRIQQLQQIQELQMQQDALQQAEILNKLKEDKKQKSDEKKKELVRDKRMSTDRKSKDEKTEHKRKHRKPIHSTDSSDSDEPKKHSIFDIVDDGPTYISMYDKVKARSCKNMQKQEEEKRQEKIKAKFSQLKRSRAKREEKKRSSWDEDSDSEHDRRKSFKNSMDSSSEDEQTVHHNKKREKSLTCSDYDHVKGIDYFNGPTTEDECRNKLSRKNSRTRIMSDTSDDDSSRRNFTRSPHYAPKIKKEVLSDPESLHSNKDTNNPLKELNDDKIKKTSLINLFGKSDSDDHKVKSQEIDDIDYKVHNLKTISNDFSSESESITSNRNISENRKKHKKKQKRHKSSFSDDEVKPESNNELDSDVKYKNSEKVRRHTAKKDKRRDKIRESVDTDEAQIKDEKSKHKKDKKSPNSSFELLHELCPNAKKEGKMEDIFGPLSDESDKECRSRKSSGNKLEYATQDLESMNAQCDKSNSLINTDEYKILDKEDNKRRKDKRRKDRKFLNKDDDNSLDVDAVSKAIEARLFADSLSNDDSHANTGLYENQASPEQSDHKFDEIAPKSDYSKSNEKQYDRFKKEFKDREKRKKRKRNKEDRQNRREHHHFHHHDKSKSEDLVPPVHSEEMPKTLLKDIPLPAEIQKVESSDNSEDSRLALESQSLPRLTDTPPMLVLEDGIKHECDSNKIMIVETENDIQHIKTIEIKEIPMPPPYNNTIENISEVPLPKDPPNIEHKIDNFINVIEIDDNETAVRSISNLEKETEKPVEKVDPHSCKVDKKLEEKPRAIISQEETEDAVAALLGESFGGKEDSFNTCYEKVENSSVREIEIENTTIENDNIPEEDAEEMRQAVQNLNASEMEIKPDTPVSDNDLLLIDTDTEEAEDTSQDAIERLPVNIIATNQSLNNNTKVSTSKVEEVPIAVISKPKTTVVSCNNSETDETKCRESNVTCSLPKRDTTVDQPTSTATPVITSWTLSNKKLLEPQLLNISSSPALCRDTNDKKPTHVAANIVQIKTSTNQVNNQTKPVLSATRVSAPYQVINHMIRPQMANMQPPTIKIPESHILYQKQQGIVISPRANSDPRLTSPKASPQGDNVTSPRLSSVAILSPSPPNLNTVGIKSSNTLPQRSPSQVTVVRMQQPPLSPIQTMHIPVGARTMVSPSRPNSVLVQTQGAPIHLNRLPVAPVMTPISKQVCATNLVHQNKTSNVNSSSVSNQPSILPPECRKNDRNVPENIAENTKIILSPTRIQPNATVLTQNRFISMPNAIHSGNINPTLQMPNKIVINKSSMFDKQESQSLNSEHSHISFNNKPIIHVANVSHSGASIIQSGSKPVMCTIQEASPINRGQGSNVIHTFNSQRMLTSLNNVIQLDSNKIPASVLSVANIRPSTVLTKTDSKNCIAATTPSLTNVVMTPLILTTTTGAKTPIRINLKNDTDHVETNFGMPLKNNVTHDKENVITGQKDFVFSNQSGCDKDLNKHATTTVEDEGGNKCETDFEELLKDNTNEIKVTNDPEKKLEINVGKTVTLITHCRERKNSDNISEKEESTKVPMLNECNENGVPVNNKNDSMSSQNDSTDILNTAKDPLIKKSEDSVSSENVEKSETNINFMASSMKSEPEKVIQKETIKLNKENTFGYSNMLSTGNEIISKTKSLDENDYWSAKDINIESVIKKVDSLCNDNIELNEKRNDFKTNTTEVITSIVTYPVIPTNCDEPMKQLDTQNDNVIISPLEDLIVEKQITPTSKRGGRGARGKRGERKQDRVQTRQITKPARGTGTGKRGRGRAKVDKKIKSLVNSSANNMPGDVYDFHEDSGDETATSPNKNETRPRLILTIKSPLSGNSNVIASSTLSIATKDQEDRIKNSDKSNKEEKTENFASPSPNTRKSRRLQEKDVQRINVFDVIDDPIKGLLQTKTKESPKRRQTRQALPKADKVQNADTRKSPRGVKRTRDRSLSDASVDSCDEKLKKEEVIRDTKIQKLTETTLVNKPESEPVQVIKTAPSLVIAQTPNPTPIPASASAPAPAPTPAPAAGAQQHPLHPHHPHHPHQPHHQHHQHIQQHHTVPAARVTITSVPSISPQSQMSRGDGMYPHFSHQHYQVYQQHFRATQHESRASPSPYTRSLEAEGSEAPTPPLELRRPPSARVPRPSHSPAHSPAPADRLLMCEPNCRPPAAHAAHAAHGTHASHGTHAPHVVHGGHGAHLPAAHLPAALPPPAAPGPPHASQVPREADSLQMLLRRYPVLWQGLLALKNDAAAVQMHFVGGNPAVAGDTLTDGCTSLLRIAQRMRLEPAQLDQVHRKMKLESEHCILLALPCGRDHMDVLQQSNNLSSGFITYLQRKQAAGIVNVAPPGHHQAVYTVHIFPSCDFANENLNRIAPDLMHRVADIAHLLIVIATV